MQNLKITSITELLAGLKFILAMPDLQAFFGLGWNFKGSLKHSFFPPPNIYVPFPFGQLPQQLLKQPIKMKVVLPAFSKPMTGCRKRWKLSYRAANPPFPTPCSKLFRAACNSRIHPIPSE